MTRLIENIQDNEKKNIKYYFHGEQNSMRTSGRPRCAIKNSLQMTNDIICPLLSNFCYMRSY
jgi:hypothetical protein